MIIMEGGSAMCSYRYRNTVQTNPDFDGEAFAKRWHKFVGSVHRHHKSQELVLFWSPEGPHPQERETLRARLEAQQGNVGSVLAAIDQRDAALNRWLAGTSREAANG